MTSQPEAFAREPQRLPSQSVAGAAPAPQSVDSGASEVVVIVRDENHPGEPNKVIIIHEASPKFMRFLSGELDGPAAGLSSMESPEKTFHLAAREPLPQLNRTLRGPITGDMPLAAPLPVASRAEKSDLAPTSLSQPRARRYVRSAASR
jgi:hypothetical protein